MPDPRPEMSTYRNERAYEFCPGCSHRLILDALDRALVRLAWDPAEIVIVSDIGCVGLSDQYFVTSGFHGLHGRSLTYATGVKLANPALHVIDLIGDGGCGIGCAHLVSAARRNIGVTTLVFNNLNFGMTGGEHSVTTPPDTRTTTTPWGNPEAPLDIAQTAAANGAGYVWRGTAFDAELEDQIVSALTHEGFALLDIWELCVAYYASINRVGPKDLTCMMEQLGLRRGLIQKTDRAEATIAFGEAWASRRGEASSLSQPLEVRFSTDLSDTASVVIAGSAGAHIRTAGRLLGVAATLSDLWTTQRDEYPVTVRSGYSISEVLLSPQPIHTTATEEIDALFILSERGYQKVAKDVGRVAPGGWLFLASDLVRSVDVPLPDGVHLRLLELDALKGIASSSLALAAVAAGAAFLGYLAPESLIEAAAQLNPAYADANQRAVRRALAAQDTVIIARQ
ncbi:MAG: thiamine pyrophosphate-dependent enzyme [Anaerolineae bacterium]